MIEAKTPYGETLRNVAAFVDENPGLPQPDIDATGGDDSEPLVRWHLNYHANWRELVGQIAALIGGEWTAEPITTFSCLRSKRTSVGYVEMFVPRYESQPALIPEIDFSDVLGTALVDPSDEVA